jgi:hypothetical protein
MKRFFDGRLPQLINHEIIRFLAFSYACFRSHFYLRLRYLVKRKNLNPQGWEGIHLANARTTAFSLARTVSPCATSEGTWAKACEAVKVPGLLFHDLRRTAARNLRRAGVAEGVIMKIGGWKTRSVFERYAIVSQSDIRDAMAKLEAGQQRDHAEAPLERKSAEEQFGQGLGRIAPKKAARDTTSSPTTPPVN